jgi:hypothetical protein
LIRFPARLRTRQEPIKRFFPAADSPGAILNTEHGNRANPNGKTTVQKQKNSIAPPRAFPRRTFS